MKKARALKLIRRLKSAEAEVSDWEGEFLSSVETRLDTYGRAFADPEKGSREAALSILQQRKLKEIKAKVAGEPPPERTPGWRRKTALGAHRARRAVPDRMCEGAAGQADEDQD